MSLKKILKVIKENRSFLIVSHVNPEGDAICSELALAQFLKSQGKRVRIINESSTPRNLLFLPGVRSISKPTIGRAHNDVVFFLDCADRERAGSAALLVTPEMRTVNIDHHISNAGFADINWVKPAASSTAEMIYELFKRGRYAITKNVATLLYIGILTDTGSFRYSNTTPQTHRIVADLLKRGVPAHKIFHAVYESNPLSDMRLLISLLKNIKSAKGGAIAWLTLTRALVNKHSPYIDLNEHIFQFLRSIRGVRAAVIFRESKAKGQVRVNFRSDATVDVGSFAARFNGGGHRAASGCSLSGSIRAIEKTIIAQLCKIRM